MGDSVSSACMYANAGLGVAETGSSVIVPPQVRGDPYIPE